MKTVICAGTSTSGKTAVLKQVIKKLIAKDYRVAFLKIDVQYAEEDELFKQEFGIPTKKVYSGELCPDHCNVMVLGMPSNGRPGSGHSFCWWKQPGCACGARPISRGHWAWWCSRPPAA